MARKITDLNEHLLPSSTDLLFVHDTKTGELKRLLLSTLLAGVGGMRTDIFLYFDVETVQPGGNSRVTFDAPFEDTNYVFLPYGMKDGNPVDVQLGTVAAGTKTTTYIVVNPAQPDTVLVWLALGRRS